MSMKKRRREEKRTLRLRLKSRDLSPRLLLWDTLAVSRGGAHSPSLGGKQLDDLVPIAFDPRL